MGFPMRLLDGALNANAGKRYIVREGVSTEAIHATQWVVAGCLLAITLVRVYCM